MVFDEATLRQLEQLSLVAEQVRLGVLKGERRSQKRGSAITFADYRDYTPGDDLRRLDWNIYARLERPFIKLLEEEEDLAVHLLLDASASMAWPEDATPVETTSSSPAGATHKFRYALRLAGALGYMALVAHDQLSVTLLGDPGRRWGPRRGHHNSLALFQFLESGAAAGETHLNAALRDYALRAGRPGLVLLISDLLSPSGYQDGVTALQARGYEVAMLHLLSPDEVEPPLMGDVKLLDVETGGMTEITLDGALAALYRRRVQTWLMETAAFCRQRGIHYVPVTTDLPWEKLVLHTLRQRLMVR